MNKEIRRALVRYIDRYEWRWNLAGRVINRYFGTAYTEKQLKKLYQRDQDQTLRIEDG